MRPAEIPVAPEDAAPRAEERWQRVGLLYSLRRTLRLLAAILRLIGLFLATKLGTTTEERFYADVRRTAERLGATFIKLGQFFAMRIDLFPRAFCEELFRLLDDVEPFGYDAVECIFREQMGGPPDEFFRVFKRRPFSSASFGQVHAAQLHDGTDVVVKVQRPGLRLQVHSDIRLLRLVARTLDLFHVMGRLKTSELIEEFEEWTRDELDYRVEADYATWLRRNAEDAQHARVPRMYPELTTSCILTCDYLEGVPLIQLVRRIWDGDAAGARTILDAYGLDLQTLASRLVQNSLKQMFDDDLFHADLHPANIIIMGGEQIGYVDFGIMGTIEAGYRDAVLLSMEGFAVKQSRKVIDCLLQISTPTERTDVQQLVRELSQNIDRYLRSFKMSNAPMPDRSLGRLVFANLATMSRNHMRTPMSVVRLFRTVWMLDTLCLMLLPTFDINEVFATYVRERRAREAERMLRDPDRWMLSAVEWMDAVQRSPALSLRALQALAQDRRYDVDFGSERAVATLDRRLRALGRTALLAAGAVGALAFAVFGHRLGGVDPAALTAAKVAAPALFVVLVFRLRGR